jgi:hypothetical protein
MKKRCKICNEEKEIEFFSKTSNGRGTYGVGGVCKDCQSIKNEVYRKNKKEIIKAKRDKVYNDPEGRKNIRTYQKEYYDKNRETLLPALLKRQKKNKNKRNERYRIKYNTDPKYKLKHNIKRAILKGLHGQTKKSRTLEILGCSIDEFKKHIESKWENWMNWKNYGKYKKGMKNYGWDLDHIIPISTANTPEEIMKLNHYTNIQPLCSYINRYIKKNNYGT